MAKIRPLPDILIDRIAAGEVITSPAAALKELMENAIDATAQKLDIETNGLESIVIVDDGEGITGDDIQNSITRHATSKLHRYEDLQVLSSFGFRGEALSSIASISHLTIQSKTQGSEYGHALISRGGDIEKVKKISHPSGTTVIVDDLFYNTPARKKHLRSLRAEKQKMRQEIIKVALARPELSIRYVHDKKQVYHWQKVTDLKQRIAQIYGDDLAKQMRKVEFKKNILYHCWGYLGDRDCYRSHRQYQFEFVNLRAVELKNLSFLVKRAYDVFLPAGNFPVYFLFFDITPELVDVNVHPQKATVSLTSDITFAGLSSYLAEVIHPVSPPNLALSYKKHSKLQQKTQTVPIPTLNTPLRFLASRMAVSTHNTSTKSESSFQYFGVVYGTYILANIEDQFTLIDQHAAHERINYERHSQQLLQNKMPVQYLLKSIDIQTEADELEKIAENLRKLQEFGYELDIWEKSLAVRSIPAYMHTPLPANEFLSFLLRACKCRGTVELFKNYIAMRACKSSVRKNDVIGAEAILHLLQRLLECNDPSVCPHGRPTMLTLNEKTISQLFERT